MTEEDDVRAGWATTTPLLPGATDVPGEQASKPPTVNVRPSRWIGGCGLTVIGTLEAFVTTPLSEAEVQEALAIVRVNWARTLPPPQPVANASTASEMPVAHTVLNFGKWNNPHILLFGAMASPRPDRS